ncbi:hypothetical protein A3759_08240 [Thalassolituus sp. HI0120]|nr:hypothetical protein A3759_08240 [Thalassolituus sp. HI0120]
MKALKTSNLRTALLSAILASVVSLTGCGSDSKSNSASSNTGNTGGGDHPDNVTQPGAGQQADGLFAVRGDWAIMNGEITSKIVEQLNSLVKHNPQVKTIVFENVPGSSDDEMNLKAGLRLRQLGLNTYLPPGGEIASGGVDLFLAGKERFSANDVLVGVHSWAGDGVQDASTLPRDHVSHKPYLDYYKALGITQDFYWFTIEAADAANIHWMSNAERKQYGITTRAASDKELNMITHHANPDKAINGLFTQYSWVNAANKKPIHIFAAESVAPLQIAKARAVMQHYLTNGAALKNKDKMSTKLGDNQASLFMFATQQDSEAAFDGSLGQSPLAHHGQDLYASEVFVEGTQNYLKRSQAEGRDATYEEILHLVQGHGLAPAEKALQDRIVSLANQALADKSWNPSQEDVNQWTAETGQNGYNSLNFEYLAAAVEGFYGLWGYSDRGLDGYLGTTRAAQQQKDPQGLALIREVWPSYIATSMPISAGFEAGQTFSLQYNPDLEYSSQSQYLQHVHLTGSNNSHILGNEQQNTLQGNAGDNRIDGAAGDRDVAVFAGLQQEYRVYQQGNEWHVVDSVTDRDGHDVLVNVEFLNFRDKNNVSVNDL